MSKLATRWQRLMASKCLSPDGESQCQSPVRFYTTAPLLGADKKRAYSAQPALSSPSPLIASGWIHRPGVTFHLHSPLKPTLFPPPPPPPDCDTTFFILPSPAFP